MLTRDILFGMNMLSLAGFIVMGLTLTLNRMGQAGKGLSIALMTGDCSGLHRAVRRGLVGIGTPSPPRSRFHSALRDLIPRFETSRVSAALRRFICGVERVCRRWAAGLISMMRPHGNNFFVLMFSKLPLNRGRKS